MIIIAEEARRVAQEGIARFPGQAEPMVARFRDAVLGSPLLVRDLYLNPSYWVVPIVQEDRLVGFVRVLGTGVVSAIGTLCRDPETRTGCPDTLTGITAEEAAARAARHTNQAPGELALAPIYIHDGPPGREAWLVQIVREGRPLRWIFVTPADVTTRPAGVLRHRDLE